MRGGTIMVLNAVATGFDQVTIGESNEFSSQAKASRNEPAVLIRLADMETSSVVIERRQGGRDRRMIDASDCIPHER